MLISQAKLESKLHAYRKSICVPKIGFQLSMHCYNFRILLHTHLDVCTVYNSAVFAVISCKNFSDFECVNVSIKINYIVLKFYSLI